VTEQSHLEEAIAQLLRLEQQALQDRDFERARLLVAVVKSYEAELARRTPGLPLAT
jgi:hypothetical protein